MAGYLIGDAAHLTGANLTGANLTGANLTDAILTGSTLTNATLTGATLSFVTSGGIIGIPAALPADWQLVAGYLIGDEANLANANLTNADLTDADLNDARLSGVTLTGATLTGATFTGSLFVNLGSHTFVTSGGVIGTPATLPVGWQLFDGFLVGDQDNLTDANLTDANLTDASLFDDILTGTTLTGATLTGADLTGVTSGGIIGVPAALPAGWQLFGGFLIGDAAHLTDANLTDANLTDANLTDAILTGSTVTGTTLTGAKLSEVRSGKIVGVPAALPGGWRLVAGYLVGTQADLAGADLQSTNLERGPAVWRQPQ